MGKYALISEQSLWGLLPLLVYLVLVFSGKKTLTATLGGVVVGAILTGQNLGGLSSLFANSLKSFLAVIGLIIMLGSGLGEIMGEAGVSNVIVNWIIEKVGVDSKKKGILAVIISSTVICALLGTLAGGNAIIAPIIIPVVASVGLTPSTVGAIFQSAGETGLIWGPFTGPVAALLAITGLTYGQMMVWAALPFGIIWLVVIYFAAQKIQKETEGKEAYDLEEMHIEAEEITPVQIRTTRAFVLTFLLLIGYGILTGQGTNYALLVMIILTGVTALFSKMGFNRMLEVLTDGMGKMVDMFLLFLLLDVMIAFIEMGGGFQALGEYLMVLVNKGGAFGLMIAGSFVGGFGVDGAAVAQLQITNDLFAPAVEAMNLPMEMWAIALIAASRITTSVYPTMNMASQMGLAKGDNIKAMLFGGWSVSLAALLYIVIWSFVGGKLFFGM